MKCNVIDLLWATMKCSVMDLLLSNNVMEYTWPFIRTGGSHLFILFDLILYIPSTIFQLNRDGSSWVEPVLS